MLRYFDGFETFSGNYPPMQAVPGLSITASYCTVGSTYARTGSMGMQLLYYSGYQMIFSVPLQTWFVGFAVRRYDINVPVYGATYPMFGFMDGLTWQMKMHVVGSEIQVRNGADTLLATTSGAGLDYRIWRYVEVGIVVDSSVGSLVLKVNENNLVNLTNINNQASENPQADTLFLSGIYNSNAHIDDLYVCDSTGAKNNTFLGDIRIDKLTPTGAGTYSDFTPSAGSNYQNVDDVNLHDGDSTYNQGSDVGDKDTYAMSDLPFPAGTEIFGVKTQITARKTDAGTRKIKQLDISGSTEELGDEKTLSDSYETYRTIYENNPDDDAAWEDADVNAVQPGIIITV